MRKISYTLYRLDINLRKKKLAAMVGGECRGNYKSTKTV